MKLEMKKEKRYLKNRFCNAECEQQKNSHNMSKDLGTACIKVFYIWSKLEVLKNVHIL